MMRKINIAAILAVCCEIAAFAAPVGSNDVARAIGNWRHRRGTLGTKMGRTVKDVRKVEWEGVSFNIVRFAGGGHAIAPVDTEIRPVMMFSEGDDLELDERNPALALVLADLRNEAERAERRRQAAAQRAQTGMAYATGPSASELEWEELLQDGLAYATEDSIDDVRVGPILGANRWGQGDIGDAPCANWYTPNNYVCGCVALSLSQIMHYFRWPQGDVDQFTSNWTKVDGVSTELTTQGGSFDWANMPDDPFDNISTEQRKAIGKLTSDVGIVFGLSYMSGSTGGWVHQARRVLTQTVFGYSNALVFLGGRTGTEEDFKRALISNFDAKLPVQLGIPGHAVVGDGYGYNGGQLYFHINMGWRGNWNYWYSMPLSETDHLGYSTTYNTFSDLVYNIFTNQSALTGIASGRVLDKRSGMPVAGIRVSAAAVGAPDVEVASAVTDDKGIYALYVQSGSYIVSAAVEHADGHGVYCGSVEITEPQLGTSVEADPAQTSDVRIYPSGKSSAQVVGNVIGCDFTMEDVAYDPQANVSLGEVSVLTNFASATIPVTAKVVHYGPNGTSAKVVVTLSPVGGGPSVSKEFVLGDDFKAHEFKASFGGLTAGERYSVTAKVVIDTGDEAGLCDGSLVAAREFAWFDERATSFTTEKWTGVPVRIEDGRMSVRCSTGEESTFSPEAASAVSERIVINVRMVGAYEEGTLPDPSSPAAISSIAGSGNLSELVVWGDGEWNPTGIRFAEDEADFEVAVDLDFVGRSVRYRIGGKLLGAYALPSGITSVSAVSFQGHSDLSELRGSGWNPNLVRDSSGAEYADFAGAKAQGAAEPFEPLWLSTWPLGTVAGCFTAKDPDGLVVPESGMTVLKREDIGGGVTRNWYAQASDADIAAGAEKYVKTTVDLGLAKAITDASVVRIGDYLVANGEMSFVVEIDDVQVAKETVKKLVEVKANMGDEWTRPSKDDIRFEDGKVVVTPSAGGASGFARVKVPEDE